MKIKLFIATFLIFPFFAMANETGVDFNAIFNKASTEQGKKDIVPNYQGTNIPETQINQHNISEEAYSTLQNNEAGSLVNDSFNTRPQYDSSEFGNIIRNTEKSNENNQAIVDKDYCDPENNVEYKICYKNYGNNTCPNNTYNKYCSNNLKLQCTSYESGCTTSGVELSSLPSDLDWSYNGGSGVLIIGKKTEANYWSGTCLVVDKTIEFNVTNLEMVDLFSLNRVVFDDYISVTLNGHLVYVGPDNGTQLIVSGGRVNDGKGIKVCERRTIWNQYVARDITPYLIKGKNTLNMRVVISGTGQGSMEFILKNKCCKDHTEEWTKSCNTGKIDDKCYLLEKICTKKDHIIRLDGNDFLKKCAEYQQSYTCRASDSCFNYDNDCDKYDISDCTLESREYMDNSNELEKFTYKCLIPTDSPNPCNQKIDCLDGECYELEPTQDNTQDMIDSLAILSTLNESVKTITPEDITMLNGENLKCEKAVVGFSDCCADDGWGNSLNLASCSPNEKKLAEKRNNSDCIYIGKYCSKEVLGVCLENEYSYCCFNNKFSKIIGNATRQQGLQTWGSAKNTNCSGIPIESLQYLDFSKIDFSELYDDIKSSVNQTDIDNRIRQSLERLKNGI